MVKVREESAGLAGNCRQLSLPYLVFNVFLKSLAKSESRPYNQN